MTQRRVRLIEAVEAETALVSADISIRASQLIYEPDDLDLLAEIGTIRRDLARLEVMVVAILRANEDVSWDAIATTLGVARQSAHRRLSRKVDDLLAALDDSVGHAEYWQGRQKAWGAAIRRLRGELLVLADLDVVPGARRRRKRRTPVAPDA